VLVSEKYSPLEIIKAINLLTYVCDWIWEKPASTHIYKYVEIQFWNIKYNISWEYKELLVCFSSLIHSYAMSFSWLTLQKATSWTACHFRTTITNDHIGVEVGGGGEPWSGRFSTCRSWHCQMVSPEAHLSSRYHK